MLSHDVNVAAMAQLFDTNYFVVAALLIALTVWKLFQWYRKFSFFQSLPGEPDYSVVYGNLHKFSIKGLGILNYINGMMKQQNPKFCRLWLGPFLPAIVVYHPETLRLILNSTAPKPRGFGRTYEFIASWADGLLTVNGEKWARARKQLTPAFHVNNLRRYMEIYNMAADKLLHLIYLSRNPLMWPGIIFKYTANGRRYLSDCEVTHQVTESIIEMRRKETVNGYPVRKEKLDILGTLLTETDKYGKPLSTLEIRNHVHTFVAAGHETTSTATCWLLYCLTQRQDYQSQVQDEIDSVLDGRESEDILCAAQARGNVTLETASVGRRVRALTTPPPGLPHTGRRRVSPPPDRAVAHREPPPGLRDVRLTENVAFKAFAVHSHWVWTALLPLRRKVLRYHPHSPSRQLSGRDVTGDEVVALEQLSQGREAKIIGKGFDRHPDLISINGNKDDLKNLDRLNLCTKESNRLYSSAPYIQRHLDQNIAVDGRTIPKGTLVILDIANLHRHPDVWDRPDEFLPERFRPESMRDKDAFSYVPFSAGPRNCIGQSFAVNEERVLAGRILQRYHITLAADGPPVARHVTIVLGFKQGLWLRIKKR